MDPCNINIIRSQRKSISIIIKPDMSVTVRAPLHMNRQDIMCFVDSKSDWIDKNLSKMADRSEANKNFPASNKILSDAEKEELKKKAYEILPNKVKLYAQQIGVTYGKISVKCMSSRWGSCSAKGDLCFNSLLMLCPEDIIDYVVIHELCHRKEMNHSKKFRNEVEKILPDFNRKRKWLKENGNAIISMKG